MDRGDLDNLPLKPSIGLAHRYLSSASVAFGSDFKRGNFDIFDARIAVTVREHVRVMGFINNLTNKYGILNGPFASQTSPSYSIVRPRTYGLRIDWSL